MMELEYVIPQIEMELCERAYRRDGRRIYVYGLIDPKVQGGLGGWKPNIDPDELFYFDLPTEEFAKKVMEDLYYGEYTGG